MTGVRGVTRWVNGRKNDVEEEETGEEEEERRRRNWRGRVHQIAKSVQYVLSDLKIN